VIAQSYTPDMAALIDSEEEIIADEFGVTLKQARHIIAYARSASRRTQAEILASVIGLLIRSKNMPVMVHALAIAFGLDELNGAHSQAEIAKNLGVTRALVSHYVVGWRDVLAGNVAAFDCTKFRKKNDTRETYKKKATNKVVQAKKKKHEYANAIQTRQG
jgi:predicted transcriptional regulator